MKHFNCKKHRNLIIALSIVFILILFLVVDIFVDPPAFWRTERQQDKKAILEYVESTYPNAIKRKGGSFPLQLPAGPHEYSVMYFELDDIEFHIGAEYGKVIFDCYPDAKAIAQFDKIIFEGFLKPRNLNAGVKYTFKDNYEGNSPYIGSLDIDITIIDQGATPQEVGWLYDFYQFWLAEGAFLKEYRIDIYIFENQIEKAHIIYDNEVDFFNEDEFYSTLKQNNGILIK